MKQKPEQKTPEEINALVLQAQSGNEDAFSELLGLYSFLMESMAARYAAGLSEEDCRDLRQEAAIAFCRALDRFHADAGVGFGYFAKICIENRLIDCRRKWVREPAGRAIPIEDPNAVAQTADDPARYILEKENYLALCERIRETLSEYENRIWTLVISGHTASEIAAETGADRKSVENAVARVRRKLRKNLPLR